jgi:hypothetical protein
MNVISGASLDSSETAQSRWDDISGVASRERMAGELIQSFRKARLVDGRHQRLQRRLVSHSRLYGDRHLGVGLEIAAC